MPNAWDPPEDLSGGFLVMEYSSANLHHRQRVHVLPFSSTTGDFTAPRGAETNLADTALAWATAVMPFYGNTWVMTVQSVWQMQSGVPVLLTLLPSVSVTGTFSTPTPPALLSGMTVFNFRTPLHHRAKIVLVANDGWAAVEPNAFNTGSSGHPGALMTYVAGADTMVVAHDGTQLSGVAKATYPYNRRLRRHYQEA